MAFIEHITPAVPALQPEMSYSEFCHRVQPLIGLRLEAYKPHQMERRLRAYADRRGAGTLVALLHRVATSPQFCQEFLDYLTINVTAFFRDGDEFTAQAQALLHTLHASHPLAIWSAGCANGAEIYSLRMLMLQEHKGEDACCLATDIDQRSLACATAGVYSAEDIRTVPPALRARYFTACPQGYRLMPEVHAPVTLMRHDLLGDPFPDAQDLIVCRNVLIYFTAEIQHQLYQAFVRSLRPGGFLWLGKAERIIDTRTLGLELRWPHVYQKIAAG